METMSFPSADEQQRILTETSAALKRSAFQMRKSIEDDNMREALKFAAAMLGELRTSQLSPQKYYELYMQAFDQMGHLESFFGEERGKGRGYGELYELVQHAGNVLPRLYLMVAVGCLYIKSREASPKDVLKDLVEMCKGVQHPTRGLFLRAYLCQRARALLPDTGSEYEGPGSGTIDDALDFLMSNFIEMNKLWVRLQHQGSARDKEKRERERQQLADLVGKNLTYLSQLDGLGFELYKDQVLPRVLDQITSCKDDLAQLYLMQALIQGFPDRFHLGTLEALLAVLPQLQPGVKVHTVMAALMDRLAKYATSPAAGGSDPKVMEELNAINAFKRFKEAISDVLLAQPEMAAADAVEMYVALMGFTGSVYPSQLANVDEVLAAAHAALSARGGLAGDLRAERQLVALLSVPLTKYGVDVALGLQQYPQLTQLLRHATHKELAIKIVNGVLDAPPAAAAAAAPQANGGGAAAPAPAVKLSTISTVTKVEQLFRFIKPLVADPRDMGEAEPDDEDLEEEQVLVARLLHHLTADDPDTHYAILRAVHAQLLLGGPKRLKTTLPALIFCGLGLHRRVAAAASGGAGEEEAAQPQVTCEALLQFLLEALQPLCGGPAAQPASGLRLLLACATAASQEAGLELLAYELVEEAFVLYEEAMADQRQRLTALYDMVGTLCQSYVYGQEHRDSLGLATTTACVKLLSRGDQARGLCKAALLWWQAERPEGAAGPASLLPAVRDGAKVLSCLQRALKLARQAKLQYGATGRVRDASYVGVFVDVLDHAMLFWDKGVPEVDTEQVQQILTETADEVASTQPDAPTLRRWSATLVHISAMQQGGNGASADTKERYAKLKAPSAPAAA